MLRNLIALAVIGLGSAVPAAEIRVAVDAAAVVHVMRGGIGASWHAIEEPITTEIDPVFGLHQHGGSGWGGNPPAEDDRAWQQLYRHAAWLGMDWLRVELEQRMYEPERKQFAWDNPEMRILYRILDWCQKHQADVFLTQMWSNVKWNAFPEFRHSPAGIVHSGPYSLDDFAEGLATCVEHLVKKKGYTCIKWLCITNEPGYKWGWWNRPPDKPMPLTPGLAAVRKSLDKRGLAVSLSGPDIVGVPDCDPQQFDFHELVGAYDFHSYGVRDLDAIAAQHTRLADWGRWAHARQRALFLSELGFAVFDGNDPGPGTYRAALHNAELVIRHLNAGVDGFNRWSFNNRGDLDGQFQMVDTWDPQRKKLLEQFPPRPNPYFVYGLLSRFTAKHSAVLKSEVKGGLAEGHPSLFAAALRSPKGEFTLAVINSASSAAEAAFELRGWPHSRQMYSYRVSEVGRDRPDLMIDPQGEFAVSPGTARFADTLPPASVSVYTTYKKAHANPGVIAE